MFNIVRLVAVVVVVEEVLSIDGRLAEYPQPPTLLHMLRMSNVWQRVEMKIAGLLN